MDVFVSYATEDRERIVPLVRALEAEGWTVWWDRDLAVGPRFHDQIQRELDAASCVVVAWSTHSIESSWCRDEAQDGLDRGILIPVQLDEVRPPLGFRSSQTASMVGWPGDRTGLVGLLSGVRAALAADGSSADGHRTGLTEVDLRRSEVIPNSVAVLPFANLSPDAEHEFFAAGMHEEILNHLAKIRDLRVIARTSVLQYADAARPIPEIANALRVTMVMEGSVRYAGERVRVTAQLNDGNTGTNVWQETYDGSLADVFEIQTDIAQQIARAMHVHLLPEDKASLDERPMTDIRAYECYLKAQHEYSRFTVEGTERSIRLLENALEFDADSELLNTALGYAYASHGSAALGADLHDEYLTKAADRARHVLAADPESSAGNSLLGAVLCDRFQTIDGLRLIKKGVDASDHTLDALKWAVMFFAMCGQTGTAKPWADELARLDPYGSFSQWVVAWRQLMEGDFEGAEAYIRRAHELDPGAPLFRTALGLVLIYLDRGEEARAVVSAGRDEGPRREVWHIVGRILDHILCLEAEAARALLDDELKADARSDMLYAWLLAECYVLLDDPDAALEWAGHAVDRGFWNYVFLRRLDPLLARLRHHPGFHALMAKTRERWRSVDQLIDNPGSPVVG